MNSDCCLCSSILSGVMLSAASLQKWGFMKLDVKSAILQTGRAHRNVYLISAKESNHKKELWLFLFVAYRQVNVNSKWQVQSDFIYRSLGLGKVPEVSELFLKRNFSGAVRLSAIKIVDDILCLGPDEVIRRFAPDFRNVLTLCTVSHGPE